MQMTVRNLPADLRKRLEALAKRKQISLNQAALDALAMGLGVDAGGRPKRDLSFFSMTAADAKHIERITAEADRADIAAQKKAARPERKRGTADANRTRHQSVHRSGKRVA